MMVTFQSVMIDTDGPDEEGCLMFANDRLVAAMVRLSDQHGDKAGCWYLEHGFGRLDGPSHPTFLDLDSAQDWAVQHLAEVRRN